MDRGLSHTVVIEKTSEAAWNTFSNITSNAIGFAGFEGDAGMSYGAPPVLPSRRIEFVGDSITAGYCNLGENDPESVADEDFALSWAHRVCDALGATCHTEAWSGFGMAQNCCDGDGTLMSDVWQRTLGTVSKAGHPHDTVDGNYWDFSWKPDALVINLGTNDQLGNRPQLVSTYNATYLSLVLSAAAVYPGTTFFLACGPMDEAYCEPVRWVISRAKAAGVNAVFLDQRNFDCECCGHPCAAVDAKIAAATSKAIAAQMGWQVE